MATAKDPYRYFRIEAAELHEQLGQGILALEQGQDAPATLALLLRLAHTLKGAARVVKLAAIADHAHAIEDILTPLRAEGAAAGRAQIDALLALHDQIGQALGQLGQPAVPAAESGAAAAAGPSAAPVQPAALAAAPSVTLADAPAAPLPAPAAAAGAAATSLRPDDGDLDSLLAAVAQAHQQLGVLRRGMERQAASGGSSAGLGSMLEDALDQTARELEQVRDSAERLRLAAAARLFGPLQRTVRDAAQALGKQAQFEGLGGEVRLDGEVLGLVRGALVQLVRNAVAHGIEAPARRVAAGKPAQGRVTVRVQRQGRRVVFECSDDGAGLDLQALQDKARRMGWITQEQRVADPQAALALLLRGGLSTAAEVNELAGRGVGLDVVRDAATRLGGEVRLRTEPGQGTAFSLSVPLRLAALEVLVVQAGGMALAIPLDAVRRSLRLSHEDVAVGAKGSTIAQEGQAVPFGSLAEALAVRSHDADEPAEAAGSGHRFSAVLIQAEAGQAALAVDRIVGTAHVTLRPPPELVPPHALVAGVSVDVEGRPQLVLDPDGLAAFARAQLPQASAAEGPALPLLVIDDSLTTRMLEQSILESAGYTVHAAVSAEQGLELARQRRYALFLVDVEMPGMDGFTFVERTRADAQLRETPAVLITSLSTAAHKQRGKDAGASGYIVKSEFAQTEFLDLVRRLVHKGR